MIKRYRFGIRIQILSLMIMLMWVVAGVNSYLAISTQRENLIQERQMRGMAVLRSWAALCKERLITGDQSFDLSMYDFMDDVMKNEKGVEELFVQDEAGKILIANDPKRNGSASPDTLFLRLLYAPKSGVFELTKHGVQYFQFYAPITLDKKKFGVARMVLSSASIEEGLREMMLRLMLATGVVVGIGLLLTILVVVKITGPIKFLTKGVEEFGRRFNPSNPATAEYEIHFQASNELGEVRDAFNDMTKTLRGSLEDKLRLKKEATQFKKDATTDAMTGLLNKRQFQDDYPVLLKHAREEHVSISMMMVDMDKFKVLNDTVGHKAGDKALQDVAVCMQEKIREGDLAYRVGGDEFVIVLPGANVRIAQERSVQIAAAYEERKAPENMTGISFGIVEYDGKESPEEFFARADAEMYRVKKAKKVER